MDALLDERQPRIRRHKLTADQYHRMGEAGVLAPDARVELIDGEVIDMAPIGSRHAATVKHLAQLLFQAVAGRAIVSVQDPIRLSPTSEPQPDLALLVPREDFYARALPTGGDALLVIEVADTSAAYDLKVKSRLYAAHGVQAYWVVDLEAGLLLCFSAPQGDAYAVESRTASPGELALPGLEAVVVDLSALLRY